MSKGSAVANRLSSILLLWVALGVRVIGLQRFPPGIMRDEALNTGISRQILQGDVRLFYWEGFGHEPLYHMLAAPFFWLLDEHYFSIRLPSALLGVLLVAVGIRLGRQYGERWSGGVLGVLLALSWWPLIFSRLGLRPILEPVLIGGSVLLWRRHPWLAGICLGAAVYTYTAGRFLWLLPLGVLIGRWLIFQRPFARPALSAEQKMELRRHVIVFGTSFILYLPLGWLLARAPELQERVQQLQGPLNAAQVGDFAPLGSSLWHTLRAFLGGGDPSWSYANPAEPLLPIWLLPFFWLGLGRTLAQSLRSEFSLKLLLWFGLGLLPTILAPDAPSLVRMIGALPPIYFFIASGLTWPFKSLFLPRLPTPRRRQAVYSGLVGCLGILLAYQLVLLTPTWSSATPTREKFQQIWLEIARYIQNEEVPVEQVVVADAWYESLRADSLRFDVYQPGLRPRWVQQGRALSFPEGGAVDLFVPEYQPLHPYLRQLVEAAAAHSTLSNTQPAFRHYHLPAVAGWLPQSDAQATFAVGADVPALNFLGLDCRPAADGNIECLSHWEVVGDIPFDTAFFLHGLKNGEIVVQEDRFDIAGETHQVGDRFVQIHQLDSAYDPTLTLMLGIYQRQSGLRFRDTANTEASFSLDLQEPDA